MGGSADVMADRPGRAVAGLGIVLPFDRVRRIQPVLGDQCQADGQNQQADLHSVETPHLTLPVLLRVVFRYWGIERVRQGDPTVGQSTKSCAGRKTARGGLKAGAERQVGRATRLMAVRERSRGPVG